VRSAILYGTFITPLVQLDSSSPIPSRVALVSFREIYLPSVPPCVVCFLACPMWAVKNNVARPFNRFSHARNFSHCRPLPKVQILFFQYLPGNGYPFLALLRLSFMAALPVSSHTTFARLPSQVAREVKGWGFLFFLPLPPTHSKSDGPLF